MVATSASNASSATPGSSRGDDLSPAPVGVHFSALDGARAFAAIGVFVTHLGLLSGFITSHSTLGPFMARMDVGVAVFFVLSGFLLYRPFVAARFAQKPPTPTGVYAKRRLIRIFPAYWVALIIIAFVLRAPAFEEPHSFVAHMLLIHAYDGTQVTGGPIQQSWTLSIEIAFYAFVPVWAWLMSRRTRSPRAQLKVEIGSLLLLAAAAWAANIGLLIGGVSGSTFSQAGIWLPLRLTDFIPGMLLAVASAWISHSNIELPRWIRSIAFGATCWALAILAFWFMSTQLGLPMFPTYSARQAFAVRVFYLAVAVLFLTPAVIGNRDSRVVSALLANRPIIWVGLVSYGIYIWHEAWMILYQRWFDEPFLQASFIRMGIFAALTTVGTAALSWYFVEKPAMNWGRGTRQPH
ncbi:MAG: acyltransferase [Microthrixaceae bacterium]|nr:acyltransferase [Microthrixaceae bacterium]